MAQAPNLKQRVAFTSWQGWVNHADAALAIDDWAVLQGASIVERLRTCGGVLLDFEQHFSRLESGCAAIGIGGLRQDEICELAQQCVEQNSAAFAGEDFSIAIVVTPGRANAGEGPTLLVHSSPIEWAKLRHWYQHGQTLEISKHRNVPKECWSPHLKTRSRLQYFLSDQSVTETFGGSVLLTLRGTLTETSVANILLVEKGKLVAPPESDTLLGISLARTIRLATDAGIEVLFEDISPERAKNAAAIVLTGSLGCLWGCSQFEGIAVNQNSDGASMVQQLQALWASDIGLDFVAQAHRLTD